jgi:Uma2 family endonuclease
MIAAKESLMYRRSSSLQDYVLVSANKIAILVPRGYANDIYHKDERGKWDIINHRSGDSVELESINLTFPIEQIFEDIVFEVG